MADRQESLALESALVELGQHIAYPPTPDLVSRTRLSLIAPTRRRPLWQRLLASPPRVVFASLVVVLLAVAGILALSPPVRTAVAGRLGLRGAPIEQVSRPPTVAAGASLDLGDPTTLAEASARLPLLVPTVAKLGEADAVYVSPSSLGGTVALVYGGRAGLPATPETGVSLLVLESRLPSSGFEPAIVGKGVGPGTQLQELSVNGGRGVWLEGAPHLLVVPDARGQFRQDRVRLAGNVLLWEQNGLLLRLEGAFSRDEALAIAASVR